MQSVVAPVLSSFIPCIKPQLPPRAIRLPSQTRTLQTARCTKRDSATSHGSGTCSDVLSTSDATSSSSGSGLDSAQQQRVTFHDLPQTPLASTSTTPTPPTRYLSEARPSDPEHNRSRSLRPFSKPSPLALPRRALTDPDHSLALSSDSDDHDHQDGSHDVTIRPPKRTFTLLQLPHRKSFSSRRKPKRAVSSPLPPSSPPSSPPTTVESRLSPPSPISELPDTPTFAVKSGSAPIRRCKSTPDRCE